MEVQVLSTAPLLNKEAREKKFRGSFCYLSARSSLGELPHQCATTRIGFDNIYLGKWTQSGLAFVPFGEAPNRKRRTGHWTVGESRSDRDCCGGLAEPRSTARRSRPTTSQDSVVLVCVSATNAASETDEE